jgi:hypothetical protein
MSIAISIDWLAVGPARAPERRAVARPRPRAPLRRTEEPIALWAVACFCCEAVSMAYQNRDRALVPSKGSGWRYRMIGDVGGWMCGACNWKYETMLPPATRGHCQGGPRPCRALLCRWNLWFDTSRKAAKDFEVLETCALDVADQGAHTLRFVGGLLGMGREGSRYVELSGLAKLRAIPGLAFDFQDDDEGFDP